MQTESHSDLVPTGARGYHVHVYTTIRIEVAVEAHDHRSAMAAADRLLFDDGLPVALIPTADYVEAVEHAEEVTGYLIDEAGDEDYRRTREDYRRTRSYGPDHRSEVRPDGAIARRTDPN